MTVINGIEIDDHRYTQNETKLAIANNDPLETHLHVVVVISNPCLYARRYLLFNEFVKRMQEEEASVVLYVVEMAYGDQRFIVTKASNPRHLQVRCDTPLWHKENMVNLAVRHLLPRDYKAFAWIDADVEFESSTWATDALKLLNGSKDVVQLFGQCVDMDRDESTMRIFHGFGYSFCKRKPYGKEGADFWHPGFAWAITRKAYEKIGGLYDSGVLGSGDSIMALAILGQVHHMHHPNYHPDYAASMDAFQHRAQSLRLGYVPGVIRHHYHGSKANRKYAERWQVLMQHAYSPSAHVTQDNNGLLIPTNQCTESFKADVLAYFANRKEDD